LSRRAADALRDRCRATQYEADAGNHYAISHLRFDLQDGKGIPCCARAAEEPATKRNRTSLEGIVAIETSVLKKRRPFDESQRKL
jgi:hypothetical protein